MYDVIKRLAVFGAAALVAVLLVWRASGARSGPVYPDRSRPTAERVQELLRRLTLAEKVGQMDQGLVTHVTTPANSPACPGSSATATAG